MFNPNRAAFLALSAAAIFSSAGAIAAPPAAVSVAELLAILNSPDSSANDRCSKPAKTWARSAPKRRSRRLPNCSTTRSFPITPATASNLIRRQPPARRCCGRRIAFKAICLLA